MRRLIALVTAGLALSLAGCRGMVSNRPPIHLNQNMDDQQRIDPQEASLVFADGQGMRPRVPGTEPHRVWSNDPVATTGKVGDGWTETLPAPLALDRALLERGQQRYGIYCAPCHGIAGDGEGTVVLRSAAIAAAPDPLGTTPLTRVSFHDDRLRAYPIGRFFDVITNGFNTMKPYAAQIPPQDRWAIAAYVRTLQRSRLATIADVPPDLAAQKGWK